MSKTSSATLIAAGVLLATLAPAMGDERPDLASRRTLVADLNGGQEVPAVNTSGVGKATFVVKREANHIDFELTYRELRGTVAQAHIHYGQPGVNGGVVVLLCGNSKVAARPLQAPPACGAHGAVGEIVPEWILGIDEQGVEAGDLDALIRILESGNAYVNVHTDRFSRGEVRGQIRQPRPGVGPRGISTDD